MDGTILGQGSFKQGDVAKNQIIAIPSTADWLEVYNWTQAGLGLGNGFEFYWQRPNSPLAMGDGTQGMYWSSGSIGGGYGPVASFFGTTTGTGSLGNDYAGTVAVKTAAGTGRLPFPRAGVSVPLVNGITAIDASSFNLAAVGSYEVSWSVQTTEVGQWQIELNGTALANTVLVDQNPTAGGHPVSGTFLITTVTPNSVLAIINPAGNSTALTITPADGAETHANSPTLTIAMVGGAGSGVGGAVSVGQTASRAFVVYDPSAQMAGSQPLLGNPVAFSALTNAAQPVLTVASTAGISVGSVIRLSGSAQTDVNGIDFVVGAVTLNTSITLLTASNVLANVPGAIGGAGFYRIVTYPPLYYPARKTVVNITQSAVAAQVSTSIEHSYTVGQAVRFNIPAVSGMVQLNTNNKNNYVYSTITSVVDAYNFIIDTNTLAYTAFTYPTIAQQPSSFPTVEPIGENTAFALTANLAQFPQYQGLNIFNANGGVFADATVNTGFYGVVLAAGSLLPAGSAGDVIFWKSGKSEFGGL